MFQMLPLRCLTNAFIESEEHIKVFLTEKEKPPDCKSSYPFCWPEAFPLQTAPSFDIRKMLHLNASLLIQRRSSLIRVKKHVLIEILTF